MSVFVTFFRGIRRQVGGAGVHGLTEISPEVDILVELCQDILCGAVGVSGPSKGHLHSVEVPDGARHRKVNGPEIYNEAL